MSGIDTVALPKVLLHDHLEGGVRAATVFELSRAAGLPLPADSIEELAAWFLGQSTTGSLVDYLESFSYTSAILQTEPNLRRIAHEYVLDLAADGVVYGEVRWAPEMNRLQGLSLEQVVYAVIEGVESGIAEARSAGHDIDVRLLICAMRNDEHSTEVAEFVAKRAGGRIVGFDIAGPEDGYLPSEHREAFDHLADALVPVTVHAGEAAGVTSIRSAVVDGRALRLGHGIRIAQDIVGDDPKTAIIGPVARWVLDRGIVLETSPTSNQHTAAFGWRGSEMTDHPFHLLDRLGFAVTVNTDNRLMSRTRLSHELDALIEAFGYGLDDLERFQRTAAEAAFIPFEQREALLETIAAGFARARADAGTQTHAFPGGAA